MIEALFRRGGWLMDKTIRMSIFLRLASHFNAVILYEPLYRRLHDNNDSGNNWIAGYERG